MRTPNHDATQQAIGETLERLGEEGVLVYDGRWDAVDDQETSPSPGCDEIPADAVLGPKRRRKPLPRQFLIVQLYGGAPMPEATQDAFRGLAYSYPGVEFVKTELVEGREVCEMCGRLISIFNLAWFPQRATGEFVFNCVDSEGCKKARIREFAKQHPEVS